MATSQLPPSLPEWEGAEEIAQQIDFAILRRDVDDLVNYVLAEDTEVLDALPEDVESNLVTPLSILAEVSSDSSLTVELIVAARLVRRSVAQHLDVIPAEILHKIRRLPE